MLRSCENYWFLWTMYWVEVRCGCVHVEYDASANCIAGCVSIEYDGIRFVGFVRTCFKFINKFIGFVQAEPVLTTPLLQSAFTKRKFISFHYLTYKISRLNKVSNHSPCDD
ncbi:hypothetical protein QVD17_01865 [Tagetes erecta]|uniref:Uncharacterized protein n=1 Tax=Tagetes erecta TaxID=13708 RepID=A0AAD8LEF8_TARER|nr:hypothetical protein QVD17_01865 [Tagetes erecta]